jgi:CTD kinase subunit alpha
MQAHPPVSKPITFKLTKPAKSALVKKFFQDDEDDEEEENTPAPPPQVNPTERALVAQANSQPPTQELSGDSTADKLSKKQTTPKLPPSPVSRTPSASARVDSTTTETVEDAAMDISPLDPLPSAPPTAKIHDPPLDLSNASGMAPSASQSEVPNFIPPSVEEPFEFLDLVGAGSYGKVFKARDVLQGKLVALKKIKMEGQHDGFPVTALREIKLLQSLRHENVVALQEMVVRKGAVFLSFEYVEHDLAGLLKQTEFVLKGEHIKSLAQQLCEGLAYIHGRSVLHRDLKTANLLVTSTGVLKLADFGLARFFNKRRAGQADYTNRVCTQWYRPPELMLGETMYGPEVDMWGAG